MSYTTLHTYKGNCYYQTKEYHSAIYEYERSLSVFEWIEPINVDWKNKVTS